jgi:hypothetical protein
MAQLPARRSGRNITLADPSREFEDIYDRMGQLINIGFGDLAPGRLPTDRGCRWPMCQRPMMPT